MLPERCAHKLPPLLALFADGVVVLAAVALGVIVRASVNPLLEGPEPAPFLITVFVGAGLLTWAGCRLRRAAPRPTADTSSSCATTSGVLDLETTPQGMWDPLEFAHDIQEDEGKRLRSLEVKHGHFTSLANAGLVGPKQRSISSQFTDTGSSCSSEIHELCSDSAESCANEPASELHASMRNSGKLCMPESDVDEPRSTLMRQESACSSPILQSEEELKSTKVPQMEAKCGFPQNLDTMDSTVITPSFHKEAPQPNAAEHKLTKSGAQDVLQQPALSTPQPDLQHQTGQGKPLWSEFLEDDPHPWDVTLQREGAHGEHGALTGQAPDAFAGSAWQAGSQAQRASTKSGMQPGQHPEGTAPGPMAAPAAAKPYQSLPTQARWSECQNDSLPPPPHVPAPQTIELSAYITDDDGNCSRNSDTSRPAGVPSSTGALKPRRKHRKTPADTGLTMQDILHTLEQVDQDHVLIVRKIKKLGFSSANKLREYFEQFGHVERILISLSHLQKRVRPASLGFVVMDSKAATAAALAVGRQQVVQENEIFVGPFEQLDRGDGGVED